MSLGKAREAVVRTSSCCLSSSVWLCLFSSPAFLMAEVGLLPAEDTMAVQRVMEDSAVVALAAAVSAAAAVVLVAAALQGVGNGVLN